MIVIDAGNTNIVIGFYTKNKLIKIIRLKTEKNGETVKNDFIKEEIFVDKIDYYFTNVIARSSKTMAECRNLKLVSLKTGTDG